MARIVVAGVLLFASVGCGVASARWSKPELLRCSSSALLPQDRANVRLAVTTTGVRFVVATGIWEAEGKCRLTDDDDFKVLVEVVGPRGAVRTVDKLSDEVEGSPVALPGGRLALLTFRSSEGDSPVAGGLGTFELRVGLPSDVLQAHRQVIAKHVASQSGVIATDARGDLAIGWTALGATGVPSGVVVRRVGRPTIRIALPEMPHAVYGAPSVAWGPHQDLLIAYTRRGRGETSTVFARYLTPAGVLERPQALGGSDDEPNIATAVGKNGQAVVVWDSQLTSPFTYTVRGTARLHDEAPFAPATLLELGQMAIDDDPDNLASSGVGAVILAGRPTVLFSAKRPGSEPEFVAQADSTGRFRRRRELLGGTSTLGGVTLSKHGTVSILYGSMFARRNVHLVTLNANGRPSGPPELVGRYGYGALAALARNPATDQLAAAWAYNTAGINGFAADAPDALVTSMRH